MSEEISTLDADTGRHRAVVYRISDGVYRVEVERLIDDLDAGGYKHGEYWCRIHGFTSYTDTPERAATLAEENLRIAQATEP